MVTPDDDEGGIDPIDDAQPATTTNTAIAAITQLASSDEKTRADREDDDERGEIIGLLRFKGIWGNVEVQRSHQRHD